MAIVLKKKSSKQVKGRERKFKVSAINVVLHPHSAKLYVDFFRDIFVSDDPVKVRGQSAVMIGSCFSMTDGRDIDGLTGVLYKFFKLDASEPWFDTKKKTAADKREVSKISIPDHLKPHLEEFSYVFFPKGHRLYFVTRRTGGQLSANFLLSYLERVSQRAEFAKYGEVKFTIEPDSDAVTKILNLKRIKSLSIDYYKPNPDDQKSAEAKMKLRLGKQNVKRVQTKLTEASSKGISPDDETKILAKIASSNGSVEAVGEGVDGKVVSLSTKSHPLVEEVVYDSNSQTERNGLQSFVADLHARIINRK